MEMKEKWEKVDMDFLKQMVVLHNKISFGKTEEAEFDKFILKIFAPKKITIGANIGILNIIKGIKNEREFCHEK